MGATAAYALLLAGTPTDLALIDINKDRAHGIMLDLEHSLSFTSFAKLTATDDLSACSSSNLVIVTAGKKQAKGETRLDLANANKKIYKDIIPRLAKAAPNAILLIVSNPVDVLTYEAIKLSGLPANQVFGSGTILDTARFQFHLSEKLKINPRSVDAYILGEHGDTSFPVLSSANVTGKRILDFKGFSRASALECYEKTRDAAYRIINDVGYTCYSISTAIAEIAKAIFEDSNQVYMLSTLLQDYYGYSDVCLSIPCVLGRKGIVKTLTVPLDKDEKTKLAKSVEVLKSFQ